MVLVHELASQPGGCAAQPVIKALPAGHPSHHLLVQETSQDGGCA